jgi:hypothetical protein
MAFDTVNIYKIDQPHINSPNWISNAIPTSTGLIFGYDLKIMSTLSDF